MMIRRQANPTLWRQYECRTRRCHDGEVWAARANVAIRSGRRALRVGDRQIPRLITGSDVYTASQSRRWDAQALRRAGRRCREVWSALARYGGRAVRSCRIRSRQQSEDKEPRDQEKGRNGRWSCRLSADGYATMHPRCAEGPGPGVVPGTRAFGDGGVDVICSRRGLRGSRWLEPGGVIVARSLHLLATTR
jgi:hypothetical protein